MTEKIELTTENRLVPAWIDEKLKELTSTHEYDAVAKLDRQGNSPLFEWLFKNSRHKSGNKGVLELMSLLTLGYKVEEEELYYLVVNNLYVNFDTKYNKISFEDNMEFRCWKTKFTLKQIKENPLLQPFEIFKVLVNEQ